MLRESVPESPVLGCNPDNGLLTSFLIPCNRLVPLSTVQAECIFTFNTGGTAQLSVPVSESLGLFLYI
jgi:hypothetical protein